MSHTILCVADEPDTGDLIQTLREQEGYVVARAADGRQAVGLIETMMPTKLVLLNVVAPYVNGFELLVGLRRNPDWQGVPIIIVSADYYERDIQRALDEGATAYVVKKLGLHDLVRAVNLVLALPATEEPSDTMADQICVGIGPGAPAPRRSNGSARRPPSKLRKKNRTR